MRPFFRRKGSKYGAIRTVVDGISFASKAEARRYSELSLLQKAGKIFNLELQPVFKFPMGFSYRADFQYVDKGLGGVWVVEDVKGFETPEFKLKKKCFLHFYPNFELRITK